MTFRDHPTDMMGNPDGRDYHYRFKANDQEAQKYLRFARWKGRYIERYPKDMEHLRTEIDHVTLKTYDKMGYIKGMRKYAKSPNWQKIPHTQGKMEMTNAQGGGSKISAKVRSGERWGTIRVEFHIDATPTEILDAYENGVNEDAITESIAEARSWAVDDRIDELDQALFEQQQACDHDHVVKDGIGLVAYCEDCQKQWRDENELSESSATIVASA